MSTVIFIVSLACGYGAAKLVAGKSAGVQGLVKSIRIPLGSYYLHLHHWLWATILLILAAAFNSLNPVVYGLLLGIILQGLTYRDRFRIVYKRQ